ncbi:MAG: FecR domain-containing protein [Lachnospiraceae bacterium]|nr:FecR domain-containing protein [Lachnospiraceae bacterium]
MMKSKKIPVLICVAALIIVAVIIIILAFSNKGHRVIKVESFSGEVGLERDDSPQKIFEDMNLKTQDVITTGTDGLIGLLADEDKNIAAIENTCFAIVSEGDEKEGALRIELKYGTSLIEIENKLPDGSSFEVKTPNASLSVRGTTFEVTYIPETNTTILKVTEGIVQADTNVESKMVNAGEMAIITDDSIVISGLSDDSAAVPGVVGDGGNTAAGDTTGTVQELPPAVSGTYIYTEDWPLLLKGGSDYFQLEYLLEVASRCEYEGEGDYLKSGLYWMCIEYGQPPFEPVEEMGDGEAAAYDVATLNEIFSFLTNDTISEEKLSAGANRLEGDRLICTITDEVDRVASAGIYEAYYGDAGEIIVDYQFNVVHSDTLEVERMRKKAYLIPDETGKYVLDYME